MYTVNIKPSLKVKALRITIPLIFTTVLLIIFQDGKSVDRTEICITAIINNILLCNLCKFTPLLNSMCIP